jgi:hypothetical protein
MSFVGKFKDMKVSDYSDRSIVVQGDTRPYKEDMKKLGGKYNSQLKGGPGWVFPKTNEKEINDFIIGGKRLVPEVDVKVCDERRKNSETPYSFSHANPSLGEFSILLSTINKMSAKINNIELALNFLLTEDQKKTLNTIVNASTMSSVEKDKSVGVKKVVKRVVKIEEGEEYESNSEEDEVIPMKRLLGKNK